MTFTGQGGVHFDRAARYTTYDVLARPREPRPAGPAAHHRLRARRRWPTRCVTRSPTCCGSPTATGCRFRASWRRPSCAALLGRTLYLEPSAEMESALGDMINRLWAGEIPCDDRIEVLAALRRAGRPAVRPGYRCGRAPAPGRSRDQGNLHPHAHGRGDLRHRSDPPVSASASASPTAATSRRAPTTCSTGSGMPGFYRRPRRRW